MPRSRFRISPKWRSAGRSQLANSAWLRRWRGAAVRANVVENPALHDQLGKHAEMVGAV